VAAVKISVVGKANVGGGLANLWEKAGHDVEAFGREGGDASAADVIVVACPSGAIADALAHVSGIEGKPAIDTTNAFGGRNEEFDSLAAEVKSITGGPVAKAFNTNFASLYDQIAEQRLPPSCLYCADAEIVGTAEQLIHDAGYEPVSVGGLDKARDLEDHLGLMFAINQAGLGKFFYRIATPGEL
jgi:8-hydroxy-5-deazaflavin:NADPH oxidoreductase